MKRLLAAIAASTLFLLPSMRAFAADDLASVEQEFNAGDYLTAINALRALISQDPNDATAHFWLGRCYYETRDLDNSVAQFEKAAQLDAKSSLYHQWLGRAYGDKADRDRSFLLARRVKKEFQEAVRLDPSNFQARRDLEDYLLEAPWIVGGSKEDALEQVKEIEKLDPLEGHLARADYDAHLGKPDDAITEYNAVLDMKPQEIEPFLEIADFYGKQGKGDQVANAELLAAEVSPKDPRLVYYRGEARVLMGTELTLAEEDLKSYIASTPTRSNWPSHAAARYWLGQLYEKEGKRTEAAEQYRASLQLDPKRKDARKALDQLEKAIH